MAATAFRAGTYEHRCGSGRATVHVRNDIGATRLEGAVRRVCEEVRNGK